MKNLATLDVAYVSLSSASKKADEIIVGGSECFSLLTTNGVDILGPIQWNDFKKLFWVIKAIIKVKLVREYPSWIRVWSFICIEKPIVLFENNCHVTEKSEAIACARRCWSSQLTGWWTKKE
jgi:hypothetical protein